ncbi:MAG: anaerobic sulfatase maturase [bacterium]
MTAPPFSLLVKPAGPDCNLRCSYCFYLEKESLFPGPDPARMSPQVLEAMIRKYMALDQPVYAFCWQGGEPTLMGLPFYRQATALQERYAPAGSVITNSIQTNATGITDALAAHLADYRFLAGCSLDGPQDVHDLHRRGTGGQGSYARVREGLDILMRHGVEVDILAMVTRANVGAPERLYDFFGELGCDRLHFIPCVRDGSARGAGAAITGEQWGAFLNGIFDRWWARDVGRVAIRLFDAVVAGMAHDRDWLCTLGRDCRQYLVVEHDGTVYPCDFFVEEGLRLGNVTDDSLAMIRAGEAYRRFGETKLTVPEECRSCRHWELCRGDCPVNRPADGRSLLCAGWLRFFDHAGPRLADLARRVRARDASGPDLTEERRS